ncbi:KRAB-A domain-containing protein 2-like [Plodia interpunctella]|uniref:KRAB-A domain-containing protein 2-like n=1 Tax=Plodia interpunctella TaxID=58824 RepID=UPI0023687EB6|nr:KRAB-A domain-containing protein 2-like [Plodia interpunctella]
MIKKVKSAKSKMSNKKPEDYQRLRRFDVITIGEAEKLIVPVKEDNTFRFYVSESEIFQILHETHLKLGHGGRNLMEKEINLRYKNITREMIVIYLNLCGDNCEKKGNISKKGLLCSVKPIHDSREMNSRCQVDLIDMQSQEDCPYKFILVYQDHLTKFVQLRPLKTKRAEEVAHALIDIFTIFGAPNILQSDNGREFATKIAEEACRIWPELKIINGKPRESQGQGTLKRAYQDIENILSMWMEVNNTNKWSDGLRFVQIIKNREYHTGINGSPYEAMFGKRLKIGLKSSSIPNEALLDVNSEEDLEKLLSTNNQVESPKKKHVDLVNKTTHLCSSLILNKSGETPYLNSITKDASHISSPHIFNIKCEKPSYLNSISDDATHSYAPTILDVKDEKTPYLNSTSENATKLSSSVSNIKCEETQYSNSMSEDAANLCSPTILNIKHEETPYSNSTSEDLPSISNIKCEVTSFFNSMSGDEMQRNDMHIRK